MTTEHSTKWILHRIERASSTTQLRRVWDDMGDTFASLTEIKTAFLVREKELTK